MDNLLRKQAGYGQLFCYPMDNSFEKILKYLIISRVPLTAYCNSTGLFSFLYCEMMIKAHGREQREYVIRDICHSQFTINLIE